MAVAESAEFLDNRTSIEGKRSGGHIQAVDRSDGVPERDAEKVLGILHMLQDVPGLVDRHCGGNRRDLYVRETGNNLAQRVRFDERVGIETSDDVGSRGGDAGVERGVLAAVLFADDAHLRMCCEACDSPSRRVGGAVVDEDDFELVARVVEREERFACSRDRRFLIITRDDDGDRGQRDARRSRAGFARGLREERYQDERFEEYRDEEKGVCEDLRAHNGVIVAQSLFLTNGRPEVLDGRGFQFGVERIHLLICQRLINTAVGDPVRITHLV